MALNVQYPGVDLNQSIIQENPNLFYKWYTWSKERNLPYSKLVDTAQKISDLKESNGFMLLLPGSPQEAIIGPAASTEYLNRASKLSIARLTLDGKLLRGRTPKLEFETWGELSDALTDAFAKAKKSALNLVSEASRTKTNNLASYKLIIESQAKKDAKKANKYIEGIDRNPKGAGRPIKLLERWLGIKDWNLEFQWHPGKGYEANKHRYIKLLKDLNISAPQSEIDDAFDIIASLYLKYGGNINYLNYFK